MNRFRTALVLAMLLVCTSAANAMVLYLDPESAFQSPTATACTASGSLSQRCNKCQRNYDQNGNEIGYGCAPVMQNGACSCTFKYTCGEVGTCTYK